MLCTSCPLVPFELGHIRHERSRAGQRRDTGGAGRPAGGLLVYFLSFNYSAYEPCQLGAAFQEALGAACTTADLSFFWEGRIFAFVLQYSHEHSRVYPSPGIWRGFAHGLRGLDGRVNVPGYADGLRRQGHNIWQWYQYCRVQL